MLSFTLTSPEILSKCFHCFSLAAVAISISTWIYAWIQDLHGFLFLWRLMEFWSTLLFHRVLVWALKQINHPVNRMTAFGVQLQFLCQLIFKCHLYRVGSSDFLSERFLGFKCLAFFYFFTIKQQLHIWQIKQWSKPKT